jgi:hypothetical protein
MSTGKGRVHFSVPGGRKKASKRVTGRGENRRHRSERLALCDAEKARAEARLCQDAKAVFPCLGQQEQLSSHLPQHIESEKLRRVAGSELWKSVGHWAPFTSSLFLDVFSPNPRRATHFTGPLAQSSVSGLVITGCGTVYSRGGFFISTVGALPGNTGYCRSAIQLYEKCLFGLEPKIPAANGGSSISEFAPDPQPAFPVYKTCVVPVLWW